MLLSYGSVHTFLKALLLLPPHRFPFYISAHLRDGSLLRPQPPELATSAQRSVPCAVTVPDGSSVSCCHRCHSPMDGGPLVAVVIPKVRCHYTCQDVEKHATCSSDANHNRMYNSLFHKSELYKLWHHDSLSVIVNIDSQPGPTFKQVCPKRQPKPSNPAVPDLSPMKNSCASGRLLG